MKEDILEQIMEDWLLVQDSTFTKNNIRYKPDSLAEDYVKRSDSNTSDIDILAVHLNKSGKERVTIVSCKSWQDGFDPVEWVRILTTENSSKVGQREPWKFFRELVKVKWAKAFVDKIHKETGQKSFIYIVAVTSIKKNKNRMIFQDCEYFKDILKNAGADEFEIKIIAVNELIESYFAVAGKNHTLASTQLGRLMQLIKASGMKLEIK